MSSAGGLVFAESVAGIDRKIFVLYGSQSGTSQEVARRLAREARRYGFVPALSSMDGCNISELPTAKYGVFVCSTTGQGEVSCGRAKSARRYSHASGARLT